MNSQDETARKSTFDRYAAWYDAFNRDKDYRAEALYLLAKVQEFGPFPKSWLDIGCGTGNHLAFLQSEGISVEGVDISPSMIAQARVAHPDIDFHVASAQNFSLPGTRDVISLMFHAMSYQTSDAMVRGAMHSISAHLAHSGVLVFDFWNTEAVLRDPPGVRVREAQIDGRTLFRIAHPTEDRQLALIHIRFEFRWDSPEGALVYQEAHTMRHFRVEELRGFLSEAGLTVVGCDAWMKNRAIGPDDWYGVICARQGRTS